MPVRDPAPAPDGPRARARVLLAIPAFRCERQIGRVIAGLDARSRESFERLVVIDNRSDDGTVAAALQALREHGLQDRGQVVRNCQNYGLGGSHKVAFRMAVEAGMDAVCILHGDNQARSEEVADLIHAYRSDPSGGSILGSRFAPGSRLEGYSRVRILGNRALNLAYSALYLRPIRDLGSGLNVFDVGRFDLGAIASFTDGFTFNMDLLLYLVSHGLPYRFVPITWRETDQVSNARNLVVGRKAAATLLAWRLGGRGRQPPSDIGRYACDVVEA